MRLGIQVDREIIAVMSILVNTDHTIGRDTIYLGIGELGKTASVKMGKMLDIAANDSFIDKAGQNNGGLKQANK